MKTSAFYFLLGCVATPAQAQNTFSLDIDGRQVRIAIPKSCEGGGSCVTITTKKPPGGLQRKEDQRIDGAAIGGVISELLSRARRRSHEPGDADPAQGPTQTTPGTADPSHSAAAVAPPAAPIAPPAAPTPSSSGAQQALAAPPSSAIPSPSTPAAVSPPPSISPPQPASSPTGVWLTQNKEGRVRIVPCGLNYCGYVVDAVTGNNGTKVLIDMKLVGDTQWSGSVHDPKGGGTYDATIALKGADTLSIRGCAFGGLVCRGQIWSRS